MSAAAPASATLAAVPGVGWIAAGGLQLGAGALGYFAGSKLSDATFNAFDGSKTNDPFMRADPTGRYPTVGDALVNQPLTKPKWLQEKEAREGTTPLSTPSGDPLLVAIENIETMVASIAGAGAATTKLILDGKDITNSVRSYVNKTKGSQTGQTFKQAIAQ
jgi:hypothetical protein